MAKNQNIPGWPEMPSITGSANHLNNPFTNGLAGGMDFIKNFWSNSSSGVPGFVVPTIDLKDLEKRIKDLKAVEGWLDVNLNMLRTTIQALEVQHNTIATIHAISDSMSNTTSDAAKSIMDASPSYMPSTPAAASDDTPSPRRQRKSKAKSNSGLPPGWPTPSTAPAPPAPKASKPVDAAGSEAAPAAKAKPAAKAAKPASNAGDSDANPAEQAAASAGAWMNFLQDQFSKVAMQSITPATAAGPKAASKTVAKKTASKTAAAKNKTK